MKSEAQNDLTFLTLSEIRAGLREKKFSSVEITRAYLKREKELKNLNCYIEVCETQALQSAEMADQKLKNGNQETPLLGVPIAVKDAIITEGVQTTSGSKILQNFIPPYDSTVVRKLKQAGAVVLGKTNMDEFAMGSSTENSAYGPVKNPWNSSHVPGGSSGGSAAAVASRLAPIALGTDTGGSIRQPASFCGLLGLKPTYGRVSRYGLIAYASSLDQIGPFARNSEDCAHLLSVISGHDQLDSTSMQVPVPDFASELKKDFRGLKLGVPKEYFIGGLQKEVETSIKNAIQTLEHLGAQTVEISLPNSKAAVSAYYILAPAEASSNLARFDGMRYGYRAKTTTGTEADLEELYCRSRTEGFGEEVKRRILIGTHVLSTGYYDAYYLKAQKVRSLIVKDFRDAFASQCDVIICPTAPTTAYKLGAKISDPLAMYLDDVFTIPVNLAGLPALSMPCGFDNQGLPIGVQLIGRPWEESTLLQLAHGFEQKTEWHTKLASC